MQSDSAAIRRTCSQIDRVEPVHCEFAFAKQVQQWLESEDSSAAVLAGYGLCGIAALYLLGGVLRAIIC